MEHNRIGKYQIVKTLGEGSFGKVKLAYHTATGQRVALKMIDRKTLAKSDMQGRIEREISYLRLLNHPHIIKLYDVIKSKEEIIMVIEYAGKELFEYIVQNGKMKDDQARRFFQQIIAAVEYCHSHKIVHRDLKPENLLLDDQLNIKIADFGLSNIMSDGNFLKTSCGSPNYAAPEVISGKLYAGPEVDVWSCGVILYVMLCGRLPFDDELIPALFKKISNGVYTLPHDLSSGAKNLLTRMLVVNPLNRITIHEIMEDEWFKVGFPEYLKPGQLDHKEICESDIDEDTVLALSTAMGFSKDEIIEAIKNGRCNETEEIFDSYELMLQNKPLINELKKQRQEEPPKPEEDWRTIPAQYQPQQASSSSTIAILPSSLPQIHKAYMSQMYPNLNITPTSTKKSKTRWHFGIRSRSYPLDVMGEIYRALQNLGAEWQRPSEEELWTIKVRWNYRGANMKMQIQLFQLEVNNYLVDFKFDGWEKEIGTDGSFGVYPFLHLSTRLIMELAVNSQG
ncbi:AMP-activated serine/threonine-protein kinase catalytic subunit [Martiniozyma asiatica (nom. inval.)]|nr:AMP-activated serine/threonine-protein kinase catalytic subunit [Martiniozyma asiatica]